MMQEHDTFPSQAPDRAGSREQDSPGSTGRTCSGAETTGPADDGDSSALQAGSLHVWSCGPVTSASPHREAWRREILACDHLFASRSLASVLGPEPGRWPEVQTAPDGQAQARDSGMDGQAAEHGAGPCCHDIMPRPTGAMEQAMTLAAQGARVHVLASGDALYHGLGGTLLRRLRTSHPEAFDEQGCLRTDESVLPFTLAFHPGPALFQAVCHRLGLDWSEAELFCVHSGPSAPLWRMLAARLAVIYTGLPLTGAVLARRLCTLDPASAARDCVLAENFGTASERLVRGSLGEIAAGGAGPTCVLILLPGRRRPRILPLGLPDTAFDFDHHCLTARQVRPLVLACLKLPSFGVLWDLGAGSGSVGLEAALLQDGLAVHAVEKKPERCQNILANAARLGADNLTLHEGDILDVMPGLPEPDRIFVGGGGSHLEAILTGALARLDPDDGDARVVVTAITMESVARLSTFTGGECLECASLDIALRTPLRTGLASRLAALNRIHLFTFRPWPQARKA